ncbi:MAG: DMT family transporter [Chloroflexota bacterium]
MSPSTKGLLFAFGSAASLSVTFVASKKALNELPPLGFATIWFALAALWGILYYAQRSQSSEKVSLQLIKQYWQPLCLLGGSNIIANYFFFRAIKLGDPTTVAFFSRSTTIFAFLMGVILLQERTNKPQWLGAAIAISGAGVMTYQGEGVIWQVMVLTLIASFFLALSSYVAKRIIPYLTPLVLNIARTSILATGLGVLAALSGELTIPSGTALRWMIGVSFFGPFLSYLLFYRGLVTLDISKAAIIRASQPLFVAVYSLVLFGTVISQQQMLGGGIILAGVSLMIGGQRLPTIRSLFSTNKKGVMQN